MAFIDFAGPAAAVTLLGAPLYFAARAYRKTCAERDKSACEMGCYCMSCGMLSPPAPNGAGRRGNAVLEGVLWVFLLWPLALGYSVWRRVAKGVRTVCPYCASTSVVPADAPAAQALRRSIGKVFLDAR